MIANGSHSPMRLNEKCFSPETCRGIQPWRNAQVSFPVTGERRGFLLEYSE